MQWLTFVLKDGASQGKDKPKIWNLSTTPSYELKVHRIGKQYLKGKSNTLSDSLFPSPGVLCPQVL